MKSSVSARLNADLLEEKYSQWSENPASVDATWAAFFEGFELGVEQLKRKEAQEQKTPEQKSPTTPAAASVSPSLSVSAAAAPAPAVSAFTTNDAGVRKQAAFLSQVVSLVYNYRTLGHTQADINPLDPKPPKQPRLDLGEYEFSEADLDRDSSTPFFRGGQHVKLSEMFTMLQDIYSGSIGFEFMHIHNTEVRHWIRNNIEARPDRQADGAEAKKKALRWLLEAELFESFLGKRFLGEKRFSLEGGEGLMVILNAILEKCPSHGVEAIEMGMAHRGRLNVLANFVRKSLRTILYEFTPNYVPDLVAGDGDVKYHLGYESRRKLDDGEVIVALAANPSHLEAVNAVVEGKARARQRIIGDDGATTDRKRVLPLLIHGDAAFAGQGSVAEVLNLSQLPGYRTGGTIHVIVNNQIGFTTMPADARSSAYATDVAKMIEAPVLHVNGEKPMELLWAAVFALEFRQKFGRDVVIDMYCYRRQGHNETDQAAFTQPHISRKIKDRLPIGQMYKNELVQDSIISADDAKRLEDEIWSGMDAEYEEMQRATEQGDRTKFSGSTAIEQPPFNFAQVQTGIAKDVYKMIGQKLTDIPNGFQVHPTLEKRFLARRREAIEQGGPIDWAFAESLAWGSLLLEGNSVRLSGQDCRRGTFSQRHAVLYDSETRDRHIPLQELSPTQAKFCVYNSLLSEAAVLGFDYGYSLGAPSILILWEAQFGDFANGAQVIIDQFISPAESKWQTPSSIVMLLPHGYEGMGPEHSSARLERFLQLCAEKNIQVGNLTTPAQYFHMLRRQKRREFMKPLVLMTPKSLLTHPLAISNEEEFLEGTAFQEILADSKPIKDPSAIKRIVFCSGKVYYDLDQYRTEHEVTDTVILRVEQLYPFHRRLVEALISQYENVTKFVWCQEEPLNMGAYGYIGRRLEAAVGGPVIYAGREAASSPATGSKAVHKKEQKALVEDAFTL